MAFEGKASTPVQVLQEFVQDWGPAEMAAALARCEEDIQYREHRPCEQVCNDAWYLRKLAPLIAALAP